MLTIMLIMAFFARRRKRANLQRAAILVITKK